MSVDGALLLPHRLGHYTLNSVLGRGGMGVVYAAHDTRLDRPVAVKMLKGLGDETAIKRFWREARAAAAVSHPHVCQVFDVHQDEAGLFLAMELLSGESLEGRLKRGPLSTRTAVAVATEILGALGALHARGFLHRDVKPSNVFLTEHGAKLLDFGVARPAFSDAMNAGTLADVTQPGMVVGTPRYMSPEQIRGEALDARSDLYAVGAVLFEMLAGRSPFTADNLYDLLYAAVHEHPPALQGPPDVVAIDRVIRRALAKDPAARYPSAEAMTEELLRITLGDTSDSAIPVRALVRMIVLPFRLARPDDEINFLSFSLAETIAGALAPLDDVIVRSTSLGARWSGEHPDLRAIAVEADVDLVLTGTLLRSSSRLRATVQLVDATSGAVVGSATVTEDVGDVFVLEDELIRAVSRLLEPRRIGARPMAPVDVPTSAVAFECFLRATELARNLDGLAQARALYQRAVDEDPTFAPAWAGLGRCLRVAAKYEGEKDAKPKAEEAFRRALALNPGLPAAHQYLTHLESEQGRADAAISRLLERARTSRNDAQLFAGLVHACRYAGLLDASLAAYEEARRLDPNVRTSIEYTLLLTGDLDRIDAMMETVNPTADPLGYAFSLMLRDRRDEGMAMVRRLESASFPTAYRASIQLARELLTDRRMQSHDTLKGVASGYHDPDACYIYGVLFAQLGDPIRSLDLLAEAVDTGYAPVEALEHNQWLDDVRRLPGFVRILETARRRQRAARAVFERGGGPALLGVR